MAVQWSPNTTVQDVTFPNSRTVIDPNSINSHATVATINGTTSSLAGGFTLRQVSRQNLTPLNSLNVSEFGQRTTVEDIEFPGTFINYDPDSIYTTGKQTTVYLTGFGPSDPTPPADTKITDTVDYQLTSAGASKSYKVWTFGAQTSKDRIEQSGSQTSLDPNSLNSSSQVTLVDATPGALSGFTLRSVVSRDLSDFHTAATGNYGLRNTVEDIEFPGTATALDSSAIATTARITIVHPTASVPADPGAPADTKLKTYTTYELTSAGTTPMSYTVFEYAPQTTEDNIEQGGTHTTLDYGSLNSQAQVTLVDATPGTMSGFALQHLTTQALSDFTTRNTATYGLLTSIEQREFPGTYTVIDNSSIEGYGQQVIIHNQTASASATIPSGLQIVDQRTIRVTSQGTPFNETTFRYGTSTTAQRIVYGSSRSWRSAISPHEDVIGEIVNSTTSDLTAANAIWTIIQSAQNLQGVAVKTLSPTKKLSVYHYSDPGTLVTGSTRGEPRMLPAIMRNGSAQTYVSVKTVAGTLKAVTIMGARVIRPVRNFVVEVTYSGTTIPDQAAYVGYANSDTYLGIAAGGLIYNGVAYRINIGLSGAYGMRLGYEFTEDFAGNFDYLGPPIGGTIETTSAAVATGSHWQVISDIASAEIVATARPTTSFTDKF
jgi:hypothetical protein